MAGLEMRILGPLEVRRDGSLLNLGGVKQRTVLAVLLLSPNEVVSVGQLIQAVWGEDASQSSTRTLQVYLSKLRAVLDPDRTSDPELIQTASPGYRCNATPETLDLLRFEQEAEKARSLAAAGDASEAVDVYSNALRLWRGDVLADLVGHSRTVDMEASRLELARLAVTADSTDAELAMGRHSELLPDIDHLVRQHPLDERLRGQLMIALYRSGRHADALASFRDMSDRLSEELGLEPGAELRQLEERILLHDPELMRREIAPPGTTITIDKRREQFNPAWVLLGEERHDLDRAVTTIGRLPDRTIVMDDQAVSRRHAEIRRVGSRYALVDVGSRNGVAVNGRTVLEHDLQDGDSVHIGAVEMVFRSEGAKEGGSV